ncbi:hypothetical protein HZA86_01675 [Candidatus Uhrbacteria bacterium]|nr:hypothetical protein [Candidatus Uhrbacteria bacterium]
MIVVEILELALVGRYTQAHRVMRASGLTHAQVESYAAEIVQDLHDDQRPQTAKHVLNTVAVLGLN